MINTHYFNINLKRNLPKQPFHIVDQSPWPIVLSGILFSLTTSAVLSFHNYPLAEILLAVSLLLLTWGMSLWFKDIITEATYLGAHTDKVQKGLSLGVVLFIISEVFFFLSSANLQALFILREICRLFLNDNQVQCFIIINTIFIVIIALFTAYHIANNLWYGVAGIERVCIIRLPVLSTYFGVSTHDEINRLDTQRPFQKAPFILSRILWWMFGIITVYFYIYKNAVRNMLSSNGNLKTEGHIDEDIKLCKHLKVQKTGGPSTELRPKNKYKREQIDITAESMNEAKGMDKPSTSYSTMRIRNHHSKIEKGTSNLEPKNFKGGSQRKPTKGLEISKISSITEPILRKVVESKLGNYSNNKEIFGNGLIRIIADHEFLIACYLIIKGKPGNMTEGINEITLDGIDIEWFKKTSKEMLDGSYKFNAVRLVEIPKDKGKSRKLGIGSPRSSKSITNLIKCYIWASLSRMFTRIPS
jgi:Cytochrome c oxidase subunit III